MNVWTTSNLLAEVKLKTMMPDLNSTMSDDDILTIANHATQDDLTPMVLQAARDYWVKTDSIDIVANQCDYRIPGRAIGQKLRDLFFVNNDGTEISLPEIDSSEAWRYRSAASSAWPGRISYQFYGDFIRLLPTPSTAGGSVQFRFYLRRGDFIDDTVGVYTNVASVAGGVITTSTDPSAAGFTTSDSIDIVRFEGPHDYLTWSVPVLAVSGSAITVAVDDIPDGIQAGDYIFLEGQTILFSAPQDFRGYFVNCVAARVMMALADPKVDQFFAVVDRDKERLRDLLEPRNDGESPRVVARSSPLRGGWGYGWRR